MLGAGILTSTACLRSGAGLVTVKTDENKQIAFQIAIPEVITTTETDLEKLLFKKSVIGFGPGLEINSNNQLLLENIIKSREIPLVIDASGLQMLSGCLDLLKKKNNAPVILTPHVGEFEKLFGNSGNDFERLDLAIQRSCSSNCIIVLKGHHTAVICPDGEVYFNTTGNAGMATAGSGDVLTGMITGLLAQGYHEKHAAILAVYLHGSAGDLAAEELSEEAMIAGDITQYLGRSFRSLSENKRAG
jgi:ADP-dependent NAD(P)H-hydrate dehydratase / NAD(P)H-hydrate epimerase